MKTKKRGMLKNFPRKFFRKGISIYVSWILVMAFVVGLSTFMFMFMRGYAETSAQQIKERGLSAIECDSLFITIDSACQNTQNLYINIINRGDITVDGMIFRMYDLYYEPQIDRKNLTLEVGKYNAKEVQLIKRGDVKKIRKIEVVPIVVSNGIRITCENKMSYYPVGDDFIADCLDRS